MQFGPFNNFEQFSNEDRCEHEGVRFMEIYEIFAMQDEFFWCDSIIRQTLPYAYIMTSSQPSYLGFQTQHYIIH